MNINVEDKTETKSSDSLQQAVGTSENLLPEKSKERYEIVYQKFMKWRSKNNVQSFSENVLMEYFCHLTGQFKPSSLWSIYSMLRSVLHIRQGVNIANYLKLKSYLKSQSDGFESKKTEILTPDQINKFIDEAPDTQYLFEKVALIIGISGACRKQELKNIKVSDVEDTGKVLKVYIPDVKTKVSRSFVVYGHFYALCKRYMDIRGRVKDSTVPQFFLNYQKGKCMKQPVGINRIAGVPQQIAKYLKLPNPNLYTGHCFRRTSATMLKGAGGDLMALNRHAGWRSSTNVDDSITNKSLTTHKIAKDIVNKENNNETVENSAVSATHFMTPSASGTLANTPGSSVIERNSGENVNTATSFPANTNAHLRESTTEGSMITGNRITNISYIFSQLKIISAHGNRLGCTFQNLVLEKEVRWGLYTKLFLKCEKCNETFNIENVDNNLSNESSINNAAVKGMRSIGRGLDDLEKFLGNLDIPYISQKTHEKHHTVDAASRKEVSVEVMKAKMSRKLSNDENTLPQKKQKMDDDVNTNSSSEPTIKTESPESLNYEVTVKQEEVCIKDEIVEEEVLQPSTSFASKNETTTDDTTIKKEITEPSFDRVFQLKITLELDCWRKIQVPGYYSFRDLHVAIQKSMGWKSVLYDYHLHKFEMINPATNLEDSILMPDDIPFYKGLMDGEVKNELNTKIAHYFKSSGDKARYEYDFGMGWDHEVVLEKILIPKEGETYPKCIAWKGKCPPEDGVLYYDQEKVDIDPLCCFKS